ncbi:MerR family transcriptional regulator [Sphingomonas sp. TX0522]|uniref:MerR family transcriptional regulator n=1 Tax=Sphingomonas sp. TX0522 TaxID=2479205 RepID=UPI0018DFD186|nr:MerR family transcriptional regulator [Sphingomonas sp. TX0522]MBI0533080.1 MerR family transcriptional regulator [Sphingomonas sp. TX0522]
MTIARLAEAGGVGVDTVRYYQRRGLMVEPARPERGGFRTYGGDDLATLKFIRQAQTAGFTLDEIDELLRLDAMADRARVRELATRRIELLDDRIAEMRAARDALARLADACGAGEEGPCPIIEAFER